MTNAVLIARNTFRGILRNKVVYLLIFLVLFMLVLAMSPYLIMRMASEAGETGIVTGLQSMVVVGSFQQWTFGSLLLGLFLGSTLISAEAKSRTIASLLYKPVERSEFLTGKWLGMLLFLVLFLCVGMAISLGLASMIGMHPSTIIVWGIALLVIDVLFYSTCAVMLATVSPPVVAGGTAFLLSVLASFVPRFIESPWVWARGIGRVLYYVLPSRNPENLIEQSFNAAILRPDYVLHLEVLSENLLYVLVLLAAACIIFKRGDIPVR